MYTATQMQEFGNSAAQFKELMSKTGIKYQPDVIDASYVSYNISTSEYMYAYEWFDEESRCYVITKYFVRPVFEKDNKFGERYDGVVGRFGEMLYCSISKEEVDEVFTKIVG